MHGDIYPLRLEPRFSRRIWGGDRLPGFLGITPREVPGEARDPIGESWMVYADNRVLNGRFAGRTLQGVADALGVRLVGTASGARYGEKVPLLAKFIDAAERLSVQVHPDDAYALTRESSSGHLGKSEAWYVLDARADAVVLWGFVHDVTREEVRLAVGEDRLERLMNRVPVRAGDVIYNPAGTVHAIGAGVLLFEIQQSSDLTYRLYDYGRVDASGGRRALHLERALDVATFAGGDASRVAPRALPSGWTRLIGCEHFVMDLLVLGGDVSEVRAAADPSSLQLVVAADGEIVLHWSGGEEALARGAAVVLPAALGGFRLTGGGRVLRCAVTPPPDAERPGGAAHS